MDLAPQVVPQRFPYPGHVRAHLGAHVRAACEEEGDYHDIAEVVVKRHWVPVLVEQDEVGSGPWRVDVLSVENIHFIGSAKAARGQHGGN